MDVTKLVRNPEKAKSHLKQIGKTIVANKDCIIQIPEKYTQKHLAVTGTEIHVCGVFPIIFEESYYTLNNTLAMFRLKPASTEMIKIDGESYYEFKFSAGDPIIVNTDLVVSDKLVYYVYNFFIEGGYIPWYLEFLDLVNLFKSTKEHAGVNLGTKATMEIIIMTMARDPKDVFKLYKHDIKDLKYIKDNPPEIIAFDSVIWNTSDTTSKLNGSYSTDAVNAALVNTSEHVELIEELLRT